MNPEQYTACLHVYGNDTEQDKPDFRGRLTALAVSELWREGVINQIVITGGTPDMNGSELGGPMERQIRRNLPSLPDDAIVLSPVARDTIQEIEEFHRIVGDNNEQLADVATKTHIPRIKTELRREFRDKANTITIFEVEKTLKESPPHAPHRYERLLTALENSQDEIGFQRREKYVLRPLSRMPFGQILLNAIRRLPNKGELLGGLTKLFAGKSSK